MNGSVSTKEAFSRADLEFMSQCCVHALVCPTLFATRTRNCGVTWTELRKGKTVAIGRQTAFKGSITALVTPFQDGRFDEDRFRALVDWQIVNGTHGLVPVGTTGESPTLSHEEHRKVIGACISEAKGRVPVIAGAGSNNTQEAIELSRFAEGAGADGLLIVTPYYNKPSQEGLFRHFKAINDAVGIPILIYNIPPRSIVDMSTDTMARLHELKNIAGRQGRHRQCRPHGTAAARARPGFHPAFGRGHDGTRGDGAWRSWLYLSDSKCRAETLRADSRRLALPAISPALDTA